jgi:hypothetical protein
MSNILATCVIVWSAGMNGNADEKFWHEMAHCNGWQHPVRVSTLGKAFDPPARYRVVYKGPIETPCGESGCSVAQAKQLCGGHFGCQWFID